MFKVTNENGVPFNVRIVRKGDRYGLDDKLVHDKADPMVEFFDARHMHTPRGQFVSRYYLSTLREREVDRGLNLYGGEPEWYLDASAMREVHAWLDREVS